MTLTGAEANGLAYELRGDCLLSGFYLNEILMRVLQKQDAHPGLYTVYQQTLVELQTSVLQQKTLRLFEKKLLQELGYGLELEQDVVTGQPLSAEKYYRFLPERGFELCEKNTEIPASMLFFGKNLISLAQEQLDDPECLREIKRLMRFVLLPLIGPQPLYSRKLFE